MIGIARQETAKVSCEVEANPPEVKFSWRFNSTLGILDLLPSNIMTEGVRSVAAFTPATEHDYGNLLCWAKNELGLQQIPCIYNLTPTGERINVSVKIQQVMIREESDDFDFKFNITFFCKYLFLIYTNTIF